MAQEDRPLARNYVLILGLIALVMGGVLVFGFVQSCGGDTTPGDAPAQAE